MIYNKNENPSSINTRLKKLERKKNTSPLLVCSKAISVAYQQ